MLVLSLVVMRLESCWYATPADECPLCVPGGPMPRFMLFLFQHLTNDSCMFSGDWCSWMPVRPLMFVSKSLLPLTVVVLIVESWSSVVSISLSMRVGSVGFGPLT